jgi:hypothetical protein
VKLLSESKALGRLEKVKSEYRSVIQNNYEPKAKNCLTCEVQGVCCTDAHFVNVHITRLEAVAVRETLKSLSEEKQQEIFECAAETVRKYNLGNSKNSFEQTFACPLFEKGIGCLVHKSAKPVPCIQHACYENKADLPPDEIQTQNENLVESLNTKTYGRNWSWLPLPVWLNLINPFKENSKIE